MTATTDLDRLITSWLDSDGPQTVDADRLAETFALTSISRQRRPVAPFVGPQPWPRSRVRRLVLRPIVLAAALGLLVLVGAILLAGAYRRPPTLQGVIDPGPHMVQPVFAPRIAALSGGRVAIAGTTTDRLLHVEVLDPATGRFQVASDLEGLPVSGMSLTALPDGSALLVVPPFATMEGSGDGGVFRIGTSGTLSLGFGPALNDRLALPMRALATWPPRLRADGRIEWADPVPWSREPIVLFDPATNAFSSQDRTGVVATPADDQDVSVDTAVPIAGDRWLIGGPDAAEIVDPATGQARPLRLPVGGSGDTATTVVDHAQVLGDGRVFLTGSDAGVYDPRDGSFTPTPLALDVSFGAALRDGSLLLTATSGSPFAPAPIALFVFNPADDTYRRIGDASLPEGTTIAQLPDGSVFAALGVSDAQPAGDLGSTWTIR